MASKNMTLNEVKSIGDQLFAIWDTAKLDIHLSGIALFHLVSLKSKFQEQLINAQEAIAAIAHNCDGVDQPDGSIKIPEANLAEANRALRELGDGVIQIEYTPIVIRSEDNLPVELMEVLIGFIEIQE